MRLAHKRKVQKKLQKRIKALRIDLIQSSLNRPVKAVSRKSIQLKAAIGSVAAAQNKDQNSAMAEITLTPKQKQVFDIVVQHVDGINTKNIGLEAGQEEAKAAAWATGALKKLLEANLVVKVQLDGNKVIYKPA
jgi:hypothetical protein